MQCQFAINENAHDILHRNGKKSCNLFGTMKDTNSNTILSKGTKQKYYIMLPKNILQSYHNQNNMDNTVKSSARQRIG